ncbi:GumC family protein [Rubripirellula reticaptiva]|uniref:Chain length determinant protein n=1 Tax=Rubripirellula reticaptiva TaxID=2528013 RepID=A0A5C6F7L2_9BACT|nr:exopolysaccharide biosynthesis protein [Rubripirellula reticaptiva]TWU56096.1 Chain length determinant protein [Rubripirellula reticaptiva]
MDRNHLATRVGHVDSQPVDSADTYNSDVWSTVSPHDLTLVIIRRLPSVLVTAGITTLSVGALLLAWPNQYASDGLLYARLGRGAVAIDPTTEPGRSVSLQDSRSSEVASISEMLGSREIADRVVQKVGAREINFPRTWTDRLANRVGSLVNNMAPSNDIDGSELDRTEFDRQVSHEEAVKRVIDSVTIKVPKNTYTISVASRFSDPVVAQKIVQSIMDQYGQYHVEAHTSVGALGFFEEQTTASHAAAIAARKKLQETKNSMGWMSVASAEESLRERILNLELSLDQANSEFADAESKAASISERLAEIEEWIPMEVTKVADNAVDGMKTQLYGHKLQDGEELSKVTASHPRYKILRDKIIQGEQIVESAEGDREQTVEALNPLRLSLETAYQTALTTAAGNKSRLESLTKSLASAQRDLNRLNQDGIVLAELGWAADIAETNYLSHSQSLESSRLVQELDNQKMSDVSVIQNASLNLKKVGPPRLILALVGGILGICLGLMQAIIRGTGQSRDSKSLASAGNRAISTQSKNPVNKSDLSQLDSESEIGHGLDDDDVLEEAFASSLPR